MLNIAEIIVGHLIGCGFTYAGGCFGIVDPDFMSRVGPLIWVVDGVITVRFKGTHYSYLDFCDPGCLDDLVGVLRSVWDYDSGLSKV